MYQPILVDADIDEGAKSRHIGDRALEQHARAQILDGVDAISKGCSLEAGARIASGFLQFRDDVTNRRQAEAVVDKYAGIESFQRGAVAHQRANVTPASGNDLFREGVGFGMDGRSVERVFPVWNTQEAGALLEGALAQPAYLQQLLAAAERSCRVTMRDDGVGKRRAKTGYACQQRRRTRC